MIYSLILLCGLAVDLTVIFAFNWLNHWYDFWILIVGFLIGIIIGVLILGLVIFFGSLTVKKKDGPYDKPSKFHHRMVMRVCEFLLQVFRCKVMVRGMDKIPTDKPFLFVPNHQGNMDSIAAVWTLRAYPNTFVVKDSLANGPFIGEFLTASGFMGLDRTNAREGVKVINRAAKRIREENLSVVICPEGTRSKSYQMNEFHHGSFKIALKANCDIVLCAIQNTCMVGKRFPFRSTKIYFDIVDVMKYEDFKDKTTQEISDYAHEKIETALNNLPKYN